MGNIIKVLSVSVALCLFGNARSAMATLITFTGVDADNATVTLGSSVNLTDGSGVDSSNFDTAAGAGPGNTTGTIVYTTSDFDIDTDSLVDTLSVTLQVVAAGGQNQLSQVGTGGFGVEGLGGEQIHSNTGARESLTFTITDISLTLTGGNPYDTSYQFESIIPGAVQSDETFDWSTNTGSGTLSSNALLPLPDDSTQFFISPQLTSGGVYTGNVDTLSFTINATSVIPEPSAAFGLLGLVTSAFFRRRRRMRA